MIEHNSSWIVNASREEVWDAVHPPVPADRSLTTFANPRVIEYRNVRIEIINEGDETGQGLVRQCWYDVPWYVGGRARSWEIVSQVSPPELQRYDVMFCTPPKATAAGWFRLEDLGDGRTKVHFHEEFRMENKWLAAFIERPVHRFISKDNDAILKGMIESRLAIRHPATAG